MAEHLDCGARLTEVRSYWNGSARLLELSDHADGDVQRMELSTRTQALLLGTGVWAQQHCSGPDAVLLVMASHPYDADSYLPESL